jgi:hypothetical protein
LDLRGTETEQLYAALGAGLTEPTRGTMDPVDFGRPRWRTALFVTAATLAWALAACVMVALLPAVDQKATDYVRAAKCSASITVPDCRNFMSAGVARIIYRTDHYRYLWQSVDQRLELHLADGTDLEAHFDGTPHWSIATGQKVTAEIWRGHVTAVTVGNQTEQTALNPIYERDQDRMTTIGLSLIALAFGIGAAVLIARAAWYKPLADYKLTVA